MSKIINVLVAIDSDSILKKFGNNTDPEHPVYIQGPNLIFMIAEPENTISGQASEELRLKGTPGDVIRWHEISSCMDFNVLLYKFVITSGDKLISTPESFVRSTTIPLPNPSDPLHPRTEDIDTSFWNSDVLRIGDVAYLFHFMILDRASKIQGYYCWDPYIHIVG